MAQRLSRRTTDNGEIPSQGGVLLANLDERMSIVEQVLEILIQIQRRVLIRLDQLEAKNAED